jgi:hypothetical protein
MNVLNHNTAGDSVKYFVLYFIIPYHGSLLGAATLIRTTTLRNTTFSSIVLCVRIHCCNFLDDLTLNGCPLISTVLCSGLALLTFRNILLSTANRNRYWVTVHIDTQLNPAKRTEPFLASRRDFCQVDAFEVEPFLHTLVFIL